MSNTFVTVLVNLRCKAVHCLFILVHSALTIVTRF